MLTTLSPEDPILLAKNTILNEENRKEKKKFSLFKSR